MMESYDITSIGIDTFGFDISSTKTSLFDDLLKAMKAHIPTAEPRHERKRIDGNMAYYCTFHKLQSKDQATGWWCIEQLCNWGWEPFSVTPISSQGSSSSVTCTYHFRKKKEET